MRGGERLLEELVGMFPDSPVYTLLHRRKKLSPLLSSRSLHQSWLGSIPGAGSFYRQALALHPAAIRSLSLPAHTRLLISSDASLIKGLRIPEGCRHLCYCHSPPRYLWEMPETYLQSSSHQGWITHTGFALFQKQLKQFDYDAAQNVDQFIANSAFTRERIRNYYGRNSEVIFPPVNTDFFQPDNGIRRDRSFLVVSSLVPYKRIDLAVAACSKLGLPLIVIGDGPEKTFLESNAGSTIRFLGRQTDEVIRQHYQSCQALIFPALEDFGMVPVEAQACGCPVIAYRAGGALESVVEGQSGLFFNEQNVSSLEQALKAFNQDSVNADPDSCRSSALRFSQGLFRDRMDIMVRRMLDT